MVRSTPDQWRYELFEERARFHVYVLAAEPIPSSRRIDSRSGFDPIPRAKVDKVFPSRSGNGLVLALPWCGLLGAHPRVRALENDAHQGFFRGFHALLGDRRPQDVAQQGLASRGVERTRTRGGVDAPATEPSACTSRCRNVANRCGSLCAAADAPAGDDQIVVPDLDT